MKIIIKPPFSSLWGKVTDVRVGQSYTLVTIAGQVLRFDRFDEDNGLKSLGLLRLTKSKVFLIVGERALRGTNFILAGWKNPQNKVVLNLQPLVVESKTFDLMNAVSKQNPDWKAWKGSFSETSVVAFWD